MITNIKVARYKKRVLQKDSCRNVWMKQRSVWVAESGDEVDVGIVDVDFVGGGLRKYSCYSSTVAVLLRCIA